MTVSVNFKFMGHALTVRGQYIPAEKQEQFYPGQPASSEVHDVFIGDYPDDVAELMNPYEDDLAEMALRAYLGEVEESRVYRMMGRAA